MWHQQYVQEYLHDILCLAALMTADCYRQQHVQTSSKILQLPETHYLEGHFIGAQLLSVFLKPSRKLWEPMNKKGHNAVNFLFVASLFSKLVRL